MAAVPGISPLGYRGTARFPSSISFVLSSTGAQGKHRVSIQRSFRADQLRGTDHSLDSFRGRDCKDGLHHSCSQSSCTPGCDAFRAALAGADADARAFVRVLTEQAARAAQFSLSSCECTVRRSLVQRERRRCDRRGRGRERLQYHP